MIKIVEYMAFAKPVVAFDLVEARASAGGGVCASPDTPEALADEIDRCSTIRHDESAWGRRDVAASRATCRGALEGLARAAVRARPVRPRFLAVRPGPGHVGVPRLPRMRVSAIVPATNRPPTLERCVHALESGDGVDEVIVVTSPRDAKAARARNIGASRSTGDLLLFVDSDVEVHSTAPRRIREAFERDPSLVALFGSYDDAPASRGTVSEFRNLLHHHVHHQSPGPATTFWTGIGAVRRRRSSASEGSTSRSTGWRTSISGCVSPATGPHRARPDDPGNASQALSFAGMVKTDFVGRAIRGWS